MVLTENCAKGVCRAPHFVYVLTMSTYRHSGDMVKVGISKNVKARVRQIGHSYQGFLAALHRSFQVSDIDEARRIETATTQNFPRYHGFPRAREILAADPEEVATFVQSLIPRGA